jgi:hypothetical protein
MALSALGTGAAFKTGRLFEHALGAVTALMLLANGGR